MGAVADEATDSATAILAIKEQCTAQILREAGTNNNFQRLLDLLFEFPVINRKEIIERLQISSPTAGELLEVFCRTGILIDVTPSKQMNKRYHFTQYLSVLSRGTEL